MTLTEFKNKYLGKQVEYHSYGAGALNQCVDLVNKYIVDVLGYDHIIGTNAKDFKDRFNKEQFTWIPNTPEAVPQKGDIVVWNGRVGGGAGHVAIVLDANVNTFTSLDQNWSKVERVTIEDHNYNNVSGWLRPKSNGSTTGETPIYIEFSPAKKLPDDFYKINEFKKLKDRKVVKGDEAFDTVMSILLKSDEDRNRAIAELEEQKKHFNEEVEALNKTRKQLIKEQKEAFDSERITLEGRIQELEEKLSNSPNNMAKEEIGKKWYHSKTIWIAVVGALSSIAIAVQAQYPEVALVGIVLSVLQVVNRFLTDQPVQKSIK
jgi:surface antigen